MITKIISGGQTGADQGGLEAGRALGLHTGGTAPRGWRTELGSQKELLEDYNLQEDWSRDYKQRTRHNTYNSDGTVIFGNTASPGTSLTLSLCRNIGRPYITNPTKETLLLWLSRAQIKCLNVAGNRESVSPGIQERTKNFLIEALSENEVEELMPQ